MIYNLDYSSQLDYIPYMESILGTCLQFSVVIPFIYGIIQWKKIDRFFKLIVVLCGMSLLFDLAGNYIRSLGMYNLPVLHTFAVVHILLLIKIWPPFFKKNGPLYQWTVPLGYFLMIVLFPCIFIIHTTAFHIVYMVTHLYSLLLGLLYYLWKTQNIGNHINMHEAKFILASGQIMLALCTCILAGTSFLFKGEDYYLNWITRQTFYTLYYICVLYALYLNSRTKNIS